VDDEEFDDFYAHTVDRLVGQLYAMTGDLSEAQDVVQEAYLRAWQRRGQLSWDGAPEAWVRTVAWRLAVSRWRRVRGSVAAWRRHGPADPGQPPSPDRTALMDALRRIPESQRVAIVLFHLCDLTVEQVAAEMRVPAGTVKARLSRGRAALAPYLDDNDRSEVSGA